MRYEHDHENDVIYFAQTNFRNQMRKFGIKTDDRRRHVYVIGKTGMGKTTLLENMILSDIYAGHGCCYIDPHGDTAEKIIDYIPSWRINDVVYFNPADADHPIGFNILEAIDDSKKHLVTSGLMSVFKKIWEGVWSARMEYIMSNSIMALLDTPGTTLLGINRMLSDKDYRKRIVGNIKDPLVKQFWVQEFAQYQDKFATEAVAPIQNKVGQFTNNAMIRNIIAQAKSSMDFRDVMDQQKIFIVNLSKGRIGEESMRLLGGMIITKLSMSAMERVDMPELERQDFYMYVDEFQNFANESFASILSEARKYRLNLIMAHQYIAQLTEEVRDAVFGNAGTIISFRVGAPDATFMEQEFMPRFVPEDVINLAKFQIYLKLMIDGVTSMPFSAQTLPPIAQNTNSKERVIAQSRERYAGNRKQIEEHVAEWSGFGEDVDLEEKYKEVSDLKKQSKKERFQHEYECTRCGNKFKLPVELDRARPIYCEECLPIIEEQRKKGKTGQRGDRKEKKVVEKAPKVKEGELVEKKSEGTSMSLSALREDKNIKLEPRREIKIENKKEELILDFEDKATVKDLADQKSKKIEETVEQNTKQNTPNNNQQSQNDDENKRKRKRRRRPRNKGGSTGESSNKPSNSARRIKPGEVVDFD